MPRVFFLSMRSVMMKRFSQFTTGGECHSLQHFFFNGLKRETIIIKYNAFYIVLQDPCLRTYYNNVFIKKHIVIALISSLLYLFLLWCPKCRFFVNLL